MVDIRSYPSSKYVPQFDKANLKASVTEAQIKYLYLGKELGGRPAEDSFYDAEGHVLYSQVATSPLFLEGISRLENGIQKFRVAIMCSEENPIACHRRLLIGRVLTAKGINVEHIRSDGNFQHEADLNRMETKNDQLTLFETEETTLWRSIQGSSFFLESRTSRNTGENIGDF